MATPKSCGCFHRDTARELVVKRNTKHGHASRGASPEYHSWTAMKARCNNSNNPFYNCYGGRGITVCERWMTDFSLFLKDMGLKPSSKHSLDRIDANGNYEPSNCRWATPSEQVNNRRLEQSLKENDRLRKRIAELESQLAR